MKSSTAPGTESNSAVSKLTTLLTSRFPAIRLAILFGSLGLAETRPGSTEASPDVSEIRPDSDVDLAVLADSPLQASEKSAIISAIAEALGRPVDLIDLHSVGEPLLGEILQGKRLLGDSTRFARLMSKHLLDAADFSPYQQRILRERRNRWINR